MPQQDSTPAAAPVFRVGNLVYTRRGLIALFFWLLWFDFAFTIMESVLGPIIQFKLKNDLKADAFLFTALLVTVPSIINFVLNPIISVASDRHRGPRGRRIPFLLVGAPLVCLSLVLLAFGHEIGGWIHATCCPGAALPEVLIWTFGILNLLFCVFNMLLSTTFYYLFNDVVPEQHFVRFMSYMRVVGGVAAILYSWLLFGYSNRTGPIDLNLGFVRYQDEAFWYPKLILIGAAGFYAVASTIALLKVREPDYPPPTPLATAGGPARRLLDASRTMARECVGHRIYVLLFLALMMNWMTFQMAQFMNPMRVDLGMDLELLGKVGALTTLIGLGLTLATARYGDRYRPLPLMVASMVLLVATSPISLLFLVPGLTPGQYLGIQIACSLVNLPINVVYGMAESTLAMSLLPRDRFGQFSAAQSMLRMIIPGILGSLLAGWLMSVLEHRFGTYAWRFAFVWNLVFQALTLGCYLLVYREWKRLGGRDGYAPPPAAAPVPLS